MNKILIVLSVVVLGYLVYVLYKRYESIMREIASLSSEEDVLAKRQTELTRVDNTSDSDKPVSKAQQAVLDSKVDKTTSVNGYSLSSDVVLSKADVGLSSVDNTADMQKPVSQAQALALVRKADKLTHICSASVYLRQDRTALQSRGIDDFGASGRGDEKTPAQYKIGNTRFRRIETTDGNWQETLYLPNVLDYPLYSHIYFECNSTYSINVSTARTDQFDYSSIPVANGNMAVFVSTGSWWAYLGQLSSNI